MRYALLLAAAGGEGGGATLADQDRSAADYAIGVLTPEAVRGRQRRLPEI